MSDEDIARFFRPGYFIAPTMINAVVEAVKTDRIKASELEMIYGLAKIIANVQARKQVTITDVDAAIEIRTPERLEQISEGTLKMGELQTILPAPRNVYQLRWKTICTAALAAYRDHKA